MATVRVRLRNDDNTASVDELDGATSIEFQVERNAKGRGAFRLKNDDPAAALITSGSIVRFTLGGLGRFPARVMPRDVDKINPSDEKHEEIEYECEGILVDWEHDVVHPSAIQCDFVPPLDERFFNVFSGEYEFDSDWEYATEIALQGWGSAFYTGQPAGWTDGAARYLWAAAGDDEDAPAGRCIFKENVLVGAGKKSLDWGADNAGTLYLNGKKINDGTDFRKKQTYEFETTAGFLTICIDAVNAPDDGPPGGNPGGVIGSLRDGGPDGTVIWQTTSSMRVLPYPATQPGMPVGEILRKCMESTAVDTTWTVVGLDVEDYLGNPWDTIEDISFRTYTDTLVSVLKAMSDAYADFKVSYGDGLELQAFVKGTAGDLPSTLDLVSGYATGASDATGNMLDLSWDVRPAKYDKLALRWAEGWLILGTGDKWGSVRAEQIKSLADATALGDALLDLNSQEQRAASFTYVPLDEDTDLPFIAFNLFDELAVPGTGSPDETYAQAVHSISVRGIDETNEAEYTIEIGDPIVDELDLIEEAVKRGAPGTTTNQNTLGSPTSGSLPASAYGTTSSPSVGSPAKIIASCPNAVSGSTETGPNVFVGLVTHLRLYGVDGSGSSTVTVFDGVTTHSLTGSGEGLIDYIDIADTSWDLSTMLTVTITSLGHRSLHVAVDVAEVTG